MANQSPAWRRGTPLKLNVKFFVCVLLVVGLSGCNQQASDNSTADPVKQESAVEHAAKHLDPTYVCPMHPQVVSDKPGTCPLCGMNLVKKELEPQMAAGERKVLYYRHPHNPGVTSDKPMKDEMGMDYVPVYDDGAGSAVKISPAVQNNMGIRTAQARLDKLWRRIDTVGYVNFDENKISHIHLRTRGWIEKLLVKSEGERVSKGQLLFEVYSPELVNAQEEYLQALRTGQHGLVSASRERLLAWGISAKQIDEMHKSRRVKQYVQVYAKQDGIVATLNVREGMFVMPEKEVMSLADLSTVWLLAEVFESQADWVKVGQYTDVRLSYLPGKEWEGKVEYIYPSLDPKNRTLKVRLVFENPNELLKPNMFADITIYGGAKKNTIIIPREALIRTGTEQRVILSLGDGRFQAREVVAGIESGDWVEIVRGLKAGETVVTSGQFLIDSEASLKASLMRMTSPVAVEDQNQHQMPAPIVGQGILREVLLKESKVNISHAPIPALGWPDMTMYFKVKPGIALDSFKPEQKVEFELEEGEEGYVIKAMKVAQE